MSAAKERSRERILTQHDPAKVHRSVDSIVLKEGSLFFVTTEAGEVPLALPHACGLFYQDCRFLDGYSLTVNGAAPILLSGFGARSFETEHHLANPELAGAGGSDVIAKNTIAIRRRRLIRSGVVHELLSIRNHGRATAVLHVELSYRSRFEDIFVLKGFVPQPRNDARSVVVSQDHVQLQYDGRDGVTRTTSIVMTPPPNTIERDRATFSVELAPLGSFEVAITITPALSKEGRERRAGSPGKSPPDAVRHWLERAEEIWMNRSASVHSSNPLVDRVLQRSMLDLRLLRSSLDGRQFFAAGIPWFVTLFGRDAATVAIQTLPYGSKTAAQTLLLLARHQATEHDPYRDAAPGKILHEFRRGELANLGVIPQSPAYYGTVDATPLFLILLAEYVAWSGDLELARRLRPNAEAALGWIANEVDQGEGLLRYSGKYENGLVNQGWKDSGNAIVDADGSMVDPPVALCEVQAYVYRAWRQSAELLRRLGDARAADGLERRAEDLRVRFERDFWDEQLGCYLLARHGENRPAAVVSSNSGQVLWGGLASPERARRVGQRLMADDMFSGWGIRTLSSESAAYNPMSYHLGSVWPHDNSIILAGFRRYALDDAALRVFDALFDAASSLRGYRLPELYCGHPRSDSEQQPISYPVACNPQAWASGALPYALWSLLGLEPDAGERRLRICRPTLPAWIDRLELRDVRVGDARVTLRFARSRNGDSLEADARLEEGELSIQQDVEEETRKVASRA